jgi:ABC-type bacteriocin/lantibiotic exporter with double-glycine peptidase domain
VVLFLIFKGTSREGLETSINESKYKYKLAYWLEELAKNMRSFKMAGNTFYHIDKSDKLLTNYLKYRNKHFKILKKQYAAIIVFKTFITVSLLAIGAALVINRQINLGQFVAAEIIILLVIASVEKLISTIEVIYDILTGIDKLGHLTDLPLEKNTGLSVSQAGCAKDVNIQINKLSYSHFLKNINLNIQQGEKIVITGGHRSGKSALVSILSGLYENYTGNVLVNGVSLQDINIDDYRSVVNMCSPRDEVFEGSIEDNIMIGRRKINLSKLIEITQALGLDEYINENKEGLNTTLGGSIDSVAYNYKQKLIIARTLVEEPHMVIIDEMFFNNKEKKSKVLKYLFDKSHYFTLILVSNDNYAFQLADRIIKLEQGEIVFDDKADNFINHND